jgi:hypothetical protein
MSSLPRPYRVRPCGKHGLQISLPTEWVDAEAIEDRDRLIARRGPAGELIFVPVRRERVIYEEGADEQG